MTDARWLVAAVLLTAATTVSAQPVPSPVRLLDVPYIQQTEALCGGAAAAMVMRYWGATDIRAESFAALVTDSERGIRADDLLQDLGRRGWDAKSFTGARALVQARLAAGQPVVTLIEDRPGYFHFVVVIAWVNGRVIHHDPARAPFRVIGEEAFDAAWSASSRWTMLLLPPSGGLSRPETPDAAAPVNTSGPCGDLVAQGIRTAETGDKPLALEIFTAAAGLCPTSSGPLREAAGVYALDGKWSDAARLARAAIDRDPKDQHAWRILATSAFVGGDAAAALEAWNAAGEPLVDLVTVQGLDRTRHAVASGVLGLEVDTVLTTRALAAAGRRLSDLPSAEVARVTYRPLGGGRASVDAVVIERPRLPTSLGSLAATGARLLTDRELGANAASITGGGELLGASWRWWENRPRVEVAYAAPSSSGIWRAEAFGEEQTYGPAEEALVEGRRGGSVTLSQWTGTLTRWQVGAGVDGWQSRGRTGSLTGSVEQRLAGDRLSLEASASLYAGAFSAWTTGLAADLRSAVRHEGTVVTGSAGFDFAAAEAPYALWSGAGSGHARRALLRAHPLLDDGRITGDVFGRRVYHAGIEVRRWVRPVIKIVRVGPAVFLDVAAADDRLRPGRAWHTDVGAGLRMAVPGSGVLRLDVGKGLRDGATAFSVGWTR
ncbi:MAG: C39 family peptidase [Acidobacteria bacterium]|nr:C39 family peptidase [Acidobacteriota bacterium]